MTYIKSIFKNLPYKDDKLNKLGPNEVSILKRKDNGGQDYWMKKNKDEIAENNEKIIEYVDYCVSMLISEHAETYNIIKDIQDQIKKIKGGK